MRRVYIRKYKWGFITLRAITLSSNGHEGCSCCLLFLVFYHHGHKTSWRAEHSDHNTKQMITYCYNN